MQASKNRKPDFQTSLAFTRKRSKKSQFSVATQKKIVLQNDIIEPVFKPLEQYAEEFRQNPRAVNLPNKCHSKTRWTLMSHFANHYNKNQQYPTMCAPKSIETGNIRLTYRRIGAKGSEINYKVPVREFEMKLPPRFWSIVKKCKKQNGKFVFFMITLVQSDHRETHANVLMFDLRHKILYRFEPHGDRVKRMGKFMDFKINQFIKHFILSNPSNDNYVTQYLSPKHIGLKYGPQTWENIFGDFVKSHPGLFLRTNGFCFVYCLLFIELMLLNPDKDPKKIIEHMSQRKLLYPEGIYIRLYLSHIMEITNYYDQCGLQKTRSLLRSPKKQQSQIIDSGSDSGRFGYYRAMENADHYLIALFHKGSSKNSLFLQESGSDSPSEINKNEFFHITYITPNSLGTKGYICDFDEYEEDQEDYDFEKIQNIPSTQISQKYLNAKPVYTHRRSKRKVPCKHISYQELQNMKDTFPDLIYVKNEPTRSQHYKTRMEMVRQYDSSSQ